jgi:electron transfer flavoprotein alpha subunit
MKDIFVLAEHRMGELRDVCFEMLSAGKKLSTALHVQLVAVLLGHDTGDFCGALRKWADRTIVVDDEKLANFNAEAYQRVLSVIVKEHRPVITLIGHTSFGMDLAASLATELDLPLATDCVDLRLEKDAFLATRQVYGGKLKADVSFVSSPCMATLRQGAFPVGEAGPEGEVVTMVSPLKEDISYRRFLQYVEAVVGDVDITQADILVSVGRGIREAKNMVLVEELAKAVGGVVACSRPIVDSGWLPTDRQVGQSGRTVKPRLYLAVGISGAFQHIAGMSNAETIVAINKDPRAPIFSVAHYGIVGDLFQVVPVLTEKLKEMKGH